MQHYSLKLLAAAAVLAPLCGHAQLSTNPDKFLGNITTWGQISPDGIEFADLWNQLTPENESKWSSCEGNKDNFGWGGFDNCYNYCKKHNIPFKQHCLIWGAQYPGWLDGLNETNQLKQITEWMDALQARYPDLELIDVVNEAIPGHQPAPYRGALGGDGITGYDWIVKAFEMAHERWPEAILIYNDFNTFQWQKDQFIDLVRILRDAGAPIDAYGCQSHDLTDMSFSSFKQAMRDIQTALKIPMYSTEYDIGTADDQKQLQQYRDQIKYMWEADYVAGITLWGYIYGRTWVTDGNSGIIRNGQDRPAMTWLREYMASDAAKTAKSPFPGMKKDHALYVRPDGWHQYINKPTVINVEAMVTDDEIDHIDLYADNNRIGTVYEAPYDFAYVPTTRGRIPLEAIMYTTNGNRYRRQGALHVVNERTPFGDEPLTVPAVIEAENFDRGEEGDAYHDSDSRNEGGARYRTDAPGVDLVTVDGGYALAYTQPGEWLEYTVFIETGGRYQYVVHAATANDNVRVALRVMDDNNDVFATSEQIDIANTGSWETYTTNKGRFNRNLKRGLYRIRLCFENSSCNIDKIELNCTKASVDDIDTAEETVYEIFTTTGMYMGKTEPVTERALPAAIYNLCGRQDIYVARDTETGEGRLVKASAR